MTEMHFWIIYLSIIVLNSILWLGIKDYPLYILISLVPLANIILAAKGLDNLFARIYFSKGKCILLHSPKKIFDSEEEKWRDGRCPSRISDCGYEKFKCNKCNHQWKETWSAF